MASLRWTILSSWTQYLVVLLTNAFCVPPAAESPSIG